ncbi:DUF3291 domain-containing protein [Dactylosporangium vinaceum]|uniref:DUF3291 domain-containing protein n=1 Tax=Dactylosporangium vinaceum TaxID=53362 RepID=A0ABV5M046_9ACTN|nr:DUF3291 domain-containing protein [Dactylosporangium vinaceum]UAB98153.1 DUF3291 domain-containing protein [Dactylosporangium vinaceum]
MTSQLAQLNVGVPVGPRDDPRMAGFYADIDRINEMADGWPGFVWRLVDESGADATSLRPFGGDLMVNMSVWTSLEALREYTFRSGHLDVLRRRREWFVPLGEAHHVMWWVPEGHRPTLGEARERLDLLRSAGPTEKAFTFRDTFAAI